MKIKYCFISTVVWIAVFFGAAHFCQAEDTAVFGCYQKEKGTLRVVSDFSECLASELPITLAGSQEEQRDFTVDCDAGETVTDVLDKAPAWGYIDITIKGTCRESVLISRDNVSLIGASSGDGLEAPLPSDFVVILNQAKHTHLEQLTITGGDIGLLASGGAGFSAESLHISGTRVGVSTSLNAYGVIDSSIIKDCDNGVEADWGGSLRVRNSNIENSDSYWGVSASLGGNVSLESGTVVRNGAYGVIVGNGGAISLEDTTIEGNDERGISASNGGNVNIYNGCVIQNNGRGAYAEGGSSITFWPGVRVANNLSYGVSARNGSSLSLFSAIIEGNGDSGVTLALGSTATFNGSIIRNNNGNGIQLEEGTLSFASFPEEDPQVEVTGNSGTAVICYQDSAGQVDSEPGIISGNGADVVDCIIPP